MIVLRIVGYDRFIFLLKAAYSLRLAGVPSSHVLVVSPPGTGKTTIAKLFAKSVGATFVRTTGRYDMLPEDFVAEKEIEYVNGNPTIVWRLRAVGKLLAKENQKPAIWFFDEFDKMNRKSMMSLLELMEEQQVTLPTGETYKLNFLLIAAGNSRKYDKDASPIPRSVRDRFVVYWELGYLPVDLEMEVLEQGINSMLGVDTAPSEQQFGFSFDRAVFERSLARVKRDYGECFVRAVSYLRTHKLVEEPPGPRAYIHATLLAATLSAVSRMNLEDATRLGFISSVAGKITVSPDTSPFEVCDEAYEANCLRSDRGSGADTSPEGGEESEFEPSVRSARARVRSLFERGRDQGGAKDGATYSLSDVARYLASLNKNVFTSAGPMPAHVASKLILSGTIREVLVPGGPTIKVVGSVAISTQPIPSHSSVGREDAELTYSKREIDLVRVADLLAHMGIDTASLSPAFLADPGDILARAMDVVTSKRGSPIQQRLVSSLMNLLEIVTDIVYSKEGDRADTLSSSIAKYSKVGEFEELTEHEKHRLHVVRSLQRTLTGSTRNVYKSFTEIGKRYVVLFDKSGSMSDTYASVTKKALGALVVALIAKSDPEARFSLIAFDSSAKIVARDCDHRQVVSELVELEPRGGTHYRSALEAATGVLDEGDILVIVGDFMDTSTVDREIFEKLRTKSSSVMLIPVGDADIDYATYLARSLGGKIYVYSKGIFVEIPIAG